jgi:hypothetical protein
MMMNRDIMKICYLLMKGPKPASMHLFALEQTTVIGMSSGAANALVAPTSTST